jgi:hypothetical protein
MACSEIRAAVLHAKTRIALRSIRIRLHHLRVTARAGSWIGKRRGQADFVFQHYPIARCEGPRFHTVRGSLRFALIAIFPKLD